MTAELIGWISRDNGAHPCSANGLATGIRFPPDIEGAAYFFCSEALGNVIKHFRATRVWVRFESAPDQLIVEVRDDGMGFAPDTVTPHGLHGLQDRIEALGGQMPITSVVGAGTMLRASLPKGRSPMIESLRVVIAKDNYLVREGTRRLLEDSGEIEVLASVGDAQELLTAVRTLGPTQC